MCLPEVGCEGGSRRAATWQRFDIDRVFLAILATASACGWMPDGDLWAQSVPPPIIVPQVVPRFNDPGPQVNIPQPGNPLQQLYPSVGSRMNSATIAHSLREDPPSRYRHARKHRIDSRTRASRDQFDRDVPSRTALIARGITCSLARCMASCFAKGQSVGATRGGHPVCSYTCITRGCI